MPSPLIVRLGPAWSRFSRPREDLQLLGTVQHHAAIGALARLPDGSYVQLNGDVQLPLNGSRVEKALRIARSRTGIEGRGAMRRVPAPSGPPIEDAEDTSPVYQVPQPAKTPVVVSVKKRRVPLLQGG